jgi:hypothetical protein
MFFDNGNFIARDEGDNIKRAQVAVLQSLKILARQNCKEHLHQDPMVEDKKTRILGQPKEIQLVLGWITNTRVLTRHTTQKTQSMVKGHSGLHSINQSESEDVGDHAGTPQPRRHHYTVSPFLPWQVLCQAETFSTQSPDV